MSEDASLLFKTGKGTAISVTLQFLFLIVFASVYLPVKDNLGVSLSLSAKKTQEGTATKKLISTFSSKKQLEKGPGRNVSTTWLFKSGRERIFSN